MKITITKDYQAHPDFDLLGYVGETNARSIEVEQPEVPGADTYKLRLDYGGVLVFDVQVENGSIPVTGSLLRKSGHVRCQWLATAAEGDNYRLVAKSNVFALRIADSIGDDVTPVPTYEQAVEALDKVLTSGSAAAENAQAAIRAKDTAQTIKSQIEELRTAAEKAAEKAINAGEYVSVISCGCVGDGVTDDTAGFKTAIDTAVQKGKTLYINPGTYLITDRLVINKPLTVIGGTHDGCVIKYRGEYHTETAYDPEYYPESNACFVVTADNCRLENFVISGGDDKEHTSQANGIILHYVKPNGTQYDAAQRVQLNQIDVKCFKNGLYLYAGWNRQITCCHFIDNADSGVKYYPLELSTVGKWAASGDVYIACQFVGNKYGINAYAAFETTIWNSVFEYNVRAVRIEECEDITLKNCWNEANEQNSYIKGCAKFEGGYNFGVTTVDHDLSGGSDIITFESKTSTIIASGGEIKFAQSSGIITKGVEISSAVDNMIANPYFADTAGAATTDSWTLYPAWAFAADTDVRYNSHNSLHYNVSSAGSDVYYQANPQAITIEPGKTYNISVYCMTPDRTTVDGDVMLYVAYKDGSGTTIAIDNSVITMIGDGNWELKERAITAPSTASSLILGFGCSKNGNVYFCEPVLSDKDALTANNVYLRQSEDSHKLNVYDMSGAKLGTLSLS